MASGFPLVERGREEQRGEHGGSPSFVQPDVGRIHCCILRGRSKTLGPVYSLGEAQNKGRNRSGSQWELSWRLPATDSSSSRSSSREDKRRSRARSWKDNRFHLGCTLWKVLSIWKLDAEPETSVRSKQEVEI